MVRVFDPLVFQTNVFQGIQVTGAQSTQANTIRTNLTIKTITSQPFDANSIFTIAATYVSDEFSGAVKRPAFDAIIEVESGDPDAKSWRGAIRISDVSCVVPSTPSRSRLWRKPIPCRREIDAFRCSAEATYR